MRPPRKQEDSSMCTVADGANEEFSCVCHKTTLNFSVQPCGIIDTIIIVTESPKEASIAFRGSQTSLDSINLNHATEKEKEYQEQVAWY